MNYNLPEHYFNKTFFTDESISHWPIHFAIITAYQDSTTNKASNENSDADKTLYSYLTQRYSWVRRVTAFDEESSDAAPSWAVNTSWQQACEIGEDLEQEAVYFVADNTLTISYCDDRRKPFPVGSFLQRLTNPKQ